jgi:hypothetical protein
MNATLLYHILSRRDWRDTRTPRDNPQRAGILAAVWLGAVVFVVPMGIWWIAHGYDIGHFIGAIAYGAGPVGAVFILVFGGGEMRSEAVRQRRDDYLLGLGGPTAILGYLILEPVAVLGYRLLRPMSFFILSAAFGFVAWAAVAAIELGILVLLLTMVCTMVFVGLITRNPGERRIGRIAAWIAMLVIAPAAASILRARFGWFEPLPSDLLNALGSSQLPILVMLTLPVWMVFSTVSLAASWLLLRGQRRHHRQVGPRRTRRRAWTLAQVVRAALETDPRLSRGPVRRAVLLALYLIIASIPLAGWLVVLGIFAWLLARRLVSVSLSSMLEDLKLTGTPAEDVGRGLRDAVAHDMFVALPGLVLAVSVMTLMAAEPLLDGISVYWLVPAALAFAAGSAYYLLTLISRLVVLKVIETAPGKKTDMGTGLWWVFYVFLLLFLLESSVFNTPTVASSTVFTAARSMFWTYSFFFAVTAIYAYIRLRRIQWESLVEWVEASLGAGET